MQDWLERYARRLDISPLDEEEVRTILALARDVAHGSERRFAPLSTFLAGVLAGSRSDIPRAETLREATDAAQQLLRPDDPGEEQKRR